MGRNYNNGMPDYPQNNNNQGMPYYAYPPRGYSKRYNKGNQGMPGTKKHSGCKITKTKRGERIGLSVLAGWKYDRRNGMRSFLAVPNHEPTQNSKGKDLKNEDWERWTVKVSQVGKLDYTVQGLYQISKDRVFIKELQYVMSPSGGVGGYVGPYIKRK